MATDVDVLEGTVTDIQYIWNNSAEILNLIDWDKSFGVHVHSALL